MKSQLIFFIFLQLDRPDPPIIFGAVLVVLPPIEADPSRRCRRRFVRRQAQTTNLTSDQNLQFEEHQFDRMVKNKTHTHKKHLYN